MFYHRGRPEAPATPPIQEAWEKSDKVWAVFDGDEHIESCAENWNRAIQLATKEQIDLSVSNPSFELWFLLHYQDQTSNIHRNGAASLLKRHLRTYVKGQKLYPNPLQPLTADAVSRASQLEFTILRDGRDVYSNPYTGVYKLVDNLSSLKKKRTIQD